jgi:outer membrane receptor protein involved in Fe transport
MTRSIWLVLALAALTASLPAQTGEITGILTDPAGAAIPGAHVSIHETSTGARRVVTTNAEGVYAAPALQPGEYAVAVQREGFKQAARTGLQLQVGQQLRLDFRMELGAVSERVEVQSQASVLDTETAAAGHVVQSRQILELPLLGRNPYSLGALVPGVRVSRGMNDLPVDQISTSSVSINGGRGNQNEYLLDGAPNTGGAQNQPIIYANPDAVQEFKVETNAYSAEYGRAAGGVFNVVTKSGTNDVHFTLYEFLRNDALNANDWFANRGGQSPPPLKFNQFGGTFGGPVSIPCVYRGRNRTFFFASVELVRFVQGITYTASVPQPVELSGDFSRTVNASGKPIVIYDPLTTSPNPNGGFVRSAFPGNIVPAGRTNPASRAVSKYFPAPNTQGALYTGANNYVRTDSNNIRKDTYSFRLDHNSNDNTRAFLRYSYDDSPWRRASPYGPDNPGSPGFGPQDFTRYNAVAEANHVFAPSLMATLRGSFSRLSNFRGPISQGFDITKLGLPANLPAQIGPPAAFPTITITGYSVAGSIPNSSATSPLGTTGLIAFGMNNYAVQGSVAKTAGHHEVRAGSEIRVIQFNSLQTADNSTNFSFGSAFTQGPNPAQSSATAGIALATFLLGIAGGSVTPSPALALETRYYAGYVQDQWKVRSNLTLSLGLRYELETPRTERYNQLTNFDGAAVPPLKAPGLDLHGALAFAGLGGLSRYQGTIDRNNFAPRAGIAWHATPKTVVRTGAGVFYGTNMGIGGAPNGFGISGFNASTNIVTSNDGVTPVTFLDNPYPTGLNRPSGAGLGAATMLGQSITFYDRNNVTPYSLQWNFDLQRELPGALLFDIGYVGTRGLKFPADLTLNQLPASTLALGDALRAQIDNPFYPQIASGILASPKISRAQLLRPYPQFDGVTAAASNWAPSTYHALQVKIEKRFSRGLTFLSSYTYSKLMDVATGPFNGETLGGGNLQDNNNLRAERGVSLLDQTHRLVVNGVYALPFLRGARGLAARLLGGWEAGVVLTFYSGGPLGVTSAVNGTFSQGGNQRPNWDGRNPALSNPTPYAWLDPQVFSTPPAYQFGTTPRTFSGTRADYTRGADISLHKNTRLREHITLQFRAEAFNVSNTPVFGPPNVSFGSPTFGVVSNQSNQPRILQFALKLIY